MIFHEGILENRMWKEKFLSGLTTLAKRNIVDYLQTYLELK